MTQSVTPTPQSDSLTANALRRLCQLARLGDFDEPLAVLARADYAAGTSTEVVVRLSGVVSAELTRRADPLFRELTPRAVHALGISPLTSAEMVVDREELLHLVARRVPN